MNEKASGNDPGAKRLRSTAPAISRRAMFAFAGTVVLVAGLVIGLNVAALREWFATRVGTPRIESIVVMPFENLAHDPEQQYFVDSMDTALWGDLAPTGTFRVISFASAARYKKAPKPLPAIAM